MEPIFIGVDVGTSNCKAAAYDLQGVQLTETTVPLTINRPQVGWAEQSCTEYWEVFLRALIQCISVVKNRKLAGIAVSSHAPTLVVLDEAGEAIRPAITWMDTRSSSQAVEIARQTGVAHPPTFNASKLWWIRQHEPSAYTRIRQVQSCSGFLCSRLVGRPVIDISNNEFFDYEHHRWDTRFLSQLDLPEDWMPIAVKTGDTMGELTQSIAKRLGVSEGIPVIAAPFDGMASLHGAGLCKPGQGALVLGTSAGVGVLSTKAPPMDTKLFAARHFHNWNWWLIGGVMTTGGSALSWFRDSLWTNCTQSTDEKKITSSLNAGAERIPPGSGGLVFLPYLSGERSPLWDVDARGVYFGLTPFHTQDHLLRALMEGIGFGIRHNIDFMAEYGVTATEYRMTGGIGRNTVWAQIFADILGAQIQVPRYVDAETLGNAMLIAVQQGYYATHQDAIAHMVSISHRVEPSSKNHEIYEDIYQLYRLLYPSLSKAFILRREIVTRRNLERPLDGRS